MGMGLGLVGDIDWPTFGVKYRHDGVDYVLHLVARDEDDARRRLRSIGISGVVLGELRGSCEVESDTRLDPSPRPMASLRARWTLIKAALSPRLTRIG